MSGPSQKTAGERIAERQPIAPIGLFEMVLEVADLAASERFYRDVIGLPVVERWGDDRPGVWLALPCVILSGIGNGAASVCNPLLVQTGAPDRVRGRAFTVVMSVNFAMLGLGMAVAGPLTDAYGARWLWAGAAAIFAAASVVAWALGRTLTARAEVEEVDFVPSTAAAP